MSTAFSFDASTVAPQASYAPIPAGVYLACVTDSDIVPLKSGSGQRMKLTFEILDGQFKGRRVWEGLNIQHPNAQAETIAQAQLSAICHAIGVVKLSDTAQLHNKPLKIRVKVRPARDGFDESNSVSGYEAASGSPSATPSAGAKPATAAPPWAKTTQQQATAEQAG